MATRTALFVAGLVLFMCLPAGAHVNLQAPNGGESYTVGDVVEVRWSILIAHSLQNWDLWYSIIGASGPWTPIAMNLPPGSPAVGSIHTYDWTIPELAVSDTVWVRVRMDNSGTDYYDVSNAPFIVEGLATSFIRGDCNSDAAVNVADAIAILDYLFGNEQEPSCLDACDGNDSDGLDIGDAVYALSYLFSMGSPPAQPFPDCGEDTTPAGPGCDLSTLGCP